MRKFIFKSSIIFFRAHVQTDFSLYEIDSMNNANVPNLDAELMNFVVNTNCLTQ